MPVNKGLLSIVENNPNFSNQALENAVNEIINVDEDDGYLWIKSQFDLQTAIDDNTVLTTSQKNDMKETINSAHPHLNIGGFLKDIIRHTASIVDASIMPLAIDGTQTETFLGILQNIDAVQSLIPQLYGGTSSEKSRSVNDHVGTLNNIFITTKDSSAPVFTRLKDTMTYLRDRGRILGGSNNFPISSAQHRYYNTQLITLMTTFVPDSTDFQQTLDNAVGLVTDSLAVIATRMGEEGFTQQITDLIAIRDEINVQVSLEKSNLLGLPDYLDTLSEYLSYAGLAGDRDLASVIANTAQDTNWQTYFRDYEVNRSYLNPVYATDTDDRTEAIDQVLADSGLPDVTDPKDFDKVANKAGRDSRINSANFDRLTSEQVIVRSCVQLGIPTANRTIDSLSGALLRNMNKHDRDLIVQKFDLNEDADTLS
jgi:hypothetical protein|tara:strand:+ start:395 stop:1672 length:1278 start_codon:yes stop_codon:yes gene_type:complete